MTPQHPLDLITRGVPSLQAWWDQYRAEDNYDPSLPRFHMSEFTLHMLRHTHATLLLKSGVPVKVVSERLGHANIACRLAEMYSELEAARSLIWRAAWAVENDPDYDYRLGSAAKLIAADSAVRVCLAAMEIFGGLAIMHDRTGVAKCLRDCLSFLHSDGAQDSHRLRIARMLEGGRA